MIFKEIELSEALRIIGDGNPDKNLFFYNELDESRGFYPDLQNYRAYKVEADDIRKYKWMLRVEGDTE